MQAEFDELSTEITRITDSTNFNDINMLNNTAAKTISLGQGSGTGVVSITAQKMDATTLALAGTYRTATGPAVATTTSNLMIGVGATDRISFTIGGDALDITIGVADKTLTEVMDLVNAESRGIQAGWDAASITGNATNGFQLVITAKDAGAVAALVVDPDSDVDGVNDVSWSAGVAGVGGTVAATAHFFQVDGAGANLDITQSASAGTIDAAIKTKDEYRALLGYKMNRLEAASSVLDVQAENLSAAESRISDVDVAIEMSAMTRNQVLAQAGISMLSQANSMPQMALQLLQG
ncbi:MAG: hypothetical protein K8S55_04160 [Phycisphaerae bacterium]|nr:hypothetical protein [Phycisphaerae bacterium]